MTLENALWSAFSSVITSSNGNRIPSGRCYTFVMKTAWNKGFTKLTHSSVAQISHTLKTNGVNNFSTWQAKQRKLKPQKYRRLTKNGDLAEMIGVVLGDGYIGQHERTQVLRIASNMNNPGFVQRYASLVEKVFAKSPRVTQRKESQCVDIVIYQNNIAELLNLQTGNKTHRVFALPDWLAKRPTYKLRFLRGLFESDGCLCHHAPTYTHKFIFTNVNQSLLDTVFMLLCEFGFHPTKTKDSIQISRKAEVLTASKLIKFRHYP